MGVLDFACVFYMSELRYVLVDAVGFFLFCCADARDGVTHFQFHTALGAFFVLLEVWRASAKVASPTILCTQQLYCTYAPLVIALPRPRLRPLVKPRGLRAGLRFPDPATCLQLRLAQPLAR